MIGSDARHESANSTGPDRRPLISVLVPTRDAEAHIRECLTGLMEQTVAERMEVIVVDQGSEQSEWAVIPQLQRRYGNIIYLRIPAATGEAHGLELALRLATGDYLTLVQATDRMRPDAYELLSAALQRNPGAMAAYGDTCFTTIPHERFDNHTWHSSKVWPEPGRNLCGDKLPPHPLWRREVHGTVGGFGANGFRDFLNTILDRFPAVHLRDFTALQLIREEWHSEPVAADGNQALRVATRGFRTSTQDAHADRDLAFAVIQPLCQGEDLSLAVRALEEHVARFPGHAVAHNDLAAVCYRAGDHQKALAHYRQAVQLAPGEPTYQKNLADFLFVESGQVDEAVRIYSELHRRAPNDLETLLNLGIISEKVGQPGEAVSFYEKAQEIQPGNEQVAERLAELRQNQGAPVPEAVAPPQPERRETTRERYQRAQSLAAQGDADGAIGELEAILASDPDFASAHNDLAVLSYQGGDKDKALAHYKKAAALAPDNSVFQKNLADFYFVEAHDVDGAIAIYLEQLRKEPGDVETLMNLGRISLLLHRPQEAETFFGKAAQLEPWNVAARDCLSNLRHSADG